MSRVIPSRPYVPTDKLIEGGREWIKALRECAGFEYFSLVDLLERLVDEIERGRVIKNPELIKSSHKVTKNLVVPFSHDLSVKYHRHEQMWDSAMQHVPENIRHKLDQMQIFKISGLEEEGDRVAHDVKNKKKVELISYSVSKNPLGFHLWWEE